MRQTSRTTGAASCSGATRFGLREVDVESIVRSHDIIYEDPALCWQDGHILGNGDMGAVAYAPYWLEWTINKTDVFDGRTAPVQRLPYREVIREMEQRHTNRTFWLNDVEKPPTSYQGPTSPRLKPCGQVKIRLGREYGQAATSPCQSRQVLSLWDATDRMTMSLPHCHPCQYEPESSSETTSFVYRHANLLVIRMRNTTNQIWQKRVELCRPYDADYAPARFGHSEAGDCIWFEQDLPDGSSYAIVLGAISTGGTYRYYDPFPNKDIRELGRLLNVGEHGDRVWINLRGDVDVFVAVVSSHESDTPLTTAQKIVSEGMGNGYARLQKKHARWWEQFWRRSFVQLEDSLLEQLWYFGLYQAASSLGHAPVPGFHGLWYGYADMPSQALYEAAYTLDQDIQIACMPVFAANHPELAIPFLDTFLNALPQAMEETRQQFDLPGAYYGIQMGFLGGTPYFSPAYRLNFSNGLFVGILFVWAYRFTRDRQLLKEKIYPFLREVVRFYAAFMQLGDDGRYHVPWSMPCELNTFGRDALDAIALLKPCLTLAIEASRLLGVDAAERSHWEDLLAKYPPYPAEKGELLDGTDMPNPPYKSQVFMYPLVLGHDSEPDIRERVRSTLKPLWATWTRQKSWPLLRWAGQLFAWVALTKLYLGDCEDLIPFIYEAVRYELKPNGLTVAWNIYPEAKNPHTRELATATPEGNSAFTMVLTEMLLQSHSGVIRVFPGIRGKATCRFGDLRAQGAFLVSAEMQDGTVTFVSIRAEKRGRAQMESPWPGKRVRCARNRDTVETISGDTLELNLRRGELAHFAAADASKATTVTAWHHASVKVHRFPDGSVVTLGKG